MALGILYQDTMVLWPLFLLLPQLCQASHLPMSPSTCRFTAQKLTEMELLPPEPPLDILSQNLHLYLHLGDPELVHWGQGSALLWVGQLALTLTK